MSSPVTNWNTTTINGVEYLVIDVAKFRIPLDWDPQSNMFLAVAAPDGALGNFPALVEGPAGPAATFTAGTLTALEYDDATADSLSVVDLGGGAYRLDITLHKGSPGAAGDTVLDVDDYGTPLPGRFLVVNDTSDGFVYQTVMVGDRYIPASIASATSGNTGYTLATVSVPAQGFAWRPHVEAQTIFTATGSGNVRVDLIARLNHETAGNIVGRGFGVPAGWFDPSAPPCVLSSGPPAGSAAEYDRVEAGSPAFIYLRAERTTGSDYFTTSASTTWFSVEVRPIPGTAADEESGS